MGPDNPIRNMFRRFRFEDDTKRTISRINEKFDAGLR